MAQEEFKFPDEKVDATPESDDIQIEIVDDTPTQDRGRAPMPKEIVEELEKDDLDEYSDKVKKRLGQMKKVWHDERRAKEAVSREKDEALRFAQQQFEENKALKQRLGQGQQALVKEITKSATTELGTAKDKLKQAYEAGDSALIADAQEAMTDAKIKLKEYEKFKPSLQEDNTGVKPVQQPRTVQPVPDRKAAAWREENDWFGPDEEMTALALGLHEKLVREHGSEYATSDDYYDRINATMRKRFPEKFEEEATQTQEQEKPVPRTKAANVVAPVTRTTSPRQVRLTPSQVSLAKRLGLSNEAYAKAVIKLESENGR